MATSTDASIRLLRLLQLVSPSLPVGAFAYSQGLEWAVEIGWVESEPALEEWLSDQLGQALTYVDLAILLRMIQAVRAQDVLKLAHWVGELQALRETAELRAEEAGRGRALAELLGSLGLLRDGSAKRPDRAQHVPSSALAIELQPGGSEAGRGDSVPHLGWRELLARSQLAGFAFAAAVWQLEPRDALLGYAWSWAENLTLAGVKLIPLGQTAGQRTLLRLAERMPAAIDHAFSLADDEIGASTPALAIASSQHETQYTRLFRS